MASSTARDATRPRTGRPTTLQRDSAIDHPPPRVTTNVLSSSDKAVREHSIPSPKVHHCAPAKCRHEFNHLLHCKAAIVATAASSTSTSSTSWPDHHEEQDTLHNHPRRSNNVWTAPSSRTEPRQKHVEKQQQQQQQQLQLNYIQSKI